SAFGHVGIVRPAIAIGGTRVALGGQHRDAFRVRLLGGGALPTHVGEIPLFAVAVAHAQHWSVSFVNGVLGRVPHVRRVHEDNLGVLCNGARPFDVQVGLTFVSL